MKTTSSIDLLNAIDNIVDPEQPNKPISYLLAELRQFRDIFVDEGAKFIDKGLTQSFLDQADELALELGHRESIWASERYNSPEGIQKWRDISEKAHDLHQIMVNELLLAFLNDPQQTSNVNSAVSDDSWISIGTNLERLIEIARKHPEACEAIGLKADYFDQAEKVVEEYTELLSHKISAIKLGETAKTARDRAAQYAKNYLTKIRIYADVIYAHDPKTRARFNSVYSVLKNRRGSKSENPGDQVKPKI